MSEPKSEVRYQKAEGRSIETGVRLVDTPGQSPWHFGGRALLDALRASRTFTHGPSPWASALRVCLGFAADGVRFSRRLERTPTSRHLANQLMRAATSSGANYREACVAERWTDFVHKLQLVLKEMREAEYWLQLLGRSDFIPENALKPLLGEADQLIRTLVKPAVTAKSKA